MLNKIILIVALLLTTSLNALQNTQNECMADGEKAPQWVCSKKIKTNEKEIFGLGKNGRSSYEKISERFAKSQAQINVVVNVIEKARKMAVEITKNEAIKTKAKVSYKGMHTETVAQFKNSKNIYILLSRKESNIDYLYVMQTNLKLLKKEKKQILSKYIKACEAGDSQKCKSVYSYYRDNKDNEKSIFYAKKSCDYGLLSSCNILANIYVNGISVREGLFWKKQFVQLEEGIKLYQKSCDKGSINACLSLASVYEARKVVKYDKVKVEKLYTKACTLGYKRACKIVAPVDEKLIKDCNSSNLKSCKTLIDIYKNYKKDDNKTAYYLDKACQLGDRKSCMSEAKNFMSAKKYKRGIDAYTKVCGAGYNYACYLLGYGYSHGSKGYTKDSSEAMKYYSKACDLGYKSACKLVK